MRIALALFLIMTLGTACSTRNAEEERLRQQAQDLLNEQQEMSLRMAAFELQVATMQQQIEQLTAAQTKPGSKGKNKVVAAPATPVASTPAVPPPTVIPFTPDKKLAAAPASTAAASEPANSTQAATVPAATVPAATVPASVETAPATTSGTVVPPPTVIPFTPDKKMADPAPASATAVATASASTASASTPPVAPEPATAASTTGSGTVVPPPTIIPFTPDNKATTTPDTKTSTATPGSAGSGTGSVATASTIPDVISAKPTDSEQAAYQKALELYSQRRYTDAGEAFDAFIAAYPRSRLYPNALYWKGECLYSQAKYADAVYAFKQVINEYPKHLKAPDALLKAAMTYRRLGDAENRDLHVRILLEDHPDAPATSKLRQVGL